jgi:hypothetical protein
VVASATTGAATADSVLAETSGAEIGIVSAGTSATITGTDTATLSASATSVDAAATAIGTNTNADAVELTTFTSGTSAAVTGTGTSTVTTAATSTDANATATSTTTAAAGVTSAGAFIAGTSAALTGSSDVSQSATATTTGDSATADAATAQTTVGNNTGLDLDTGATMIGTAGTISGRVSGANSATATGTTADATATVTITETAGIDLATTLSTSTSAEISASSLGTNTATATSVGADATSRILQGTGNALGDGAGTIIAGTSASIGATATFFNTASATTTSGNNTGADASVETNIVAAVDVATITSGTTLAMAAAASSTQTANATNVGTSGTNSKNDAYATVANYTSISGIDDTTITVGTNTTAFSATANLAGSATANSTFGDVSATTGTGDANVSGLTTSGLNTLTIGLDAVGGISLAATTTISGLANTVWEGALANVGDATATSIGNDQVDITVGRDAGTIYASSTNALTATAATSGGLTGEDIASAVINQFAVATKDSKIVIGNDGNLTNVATTIGNSRATNVGDSLDTDLSSASLTLDVRGLSELASTSDVAIGADGNVQSQAQSSGSAFAQNVNGSSGGGLTANAGAYAIGDLDVYGTSLSTNETDITIGQTGNITGLAIVGTLSVGVLGNQVSVTSTTTEGTSYAVGTVDSAGILGTGTSSTAAAVGGNQSLLTAGPIDGDVIGQSITGMAVLANTIGSGGLYADDASSSMLATIGGLQNVDILGAQIGVNLIKGTTTGDYDSTAISIAGDSTAVGTLTGYGVYDTSGTGNITSSGNIQAVSYLLNTVVASSVAGGVTATDVTTAVGLGNYNVIITGSGTLTGNATGLGDSTASSVSGRASS